jgi:DNA (cytosine-5)-methyltransferase 1
MKYLSVCSGIEAATLAWHPLGWQAVAYSEIDPFPSAVLAHHYPDTPNLGDMTQHREWDSGRIGAIDVLAGGTPCQSFSVAGLRQGLNDPRGNLMLTYLAIAERFKPRWLVWENVPGVLSSNRGRDFGTFLGALAKLGYGWAYRVLDAQWFGLAQRRRRVFVVGYLGDASRAAKVLFESESVCRDTSPHRSSQQALAKCLTSRAGSSGFDAETDLHEAPIVKCFYPSDARKRGAITLHDQVKTLTSQGKQGDSEPCFVCEPSMGVRQPLHPLNTQIAMRHNALGERTGLGIGNDNDPAFTLQAGHSHGIISPMAVRRLTPRECERLQGFPDDYTAIPWRRKAADQCPDGPRYKALGNSMAVPVMQWIGKRIMVIG